MQLSYCNDFSIIGMSASANTDNEFISSGLVQKENEIKTSSVAVSCKLLSRDLELGNVLAAQH